MMEYMLILIATSSMNVLIRRLTSNRVLMDCSLIHNSSIVTGPLMLSVINQNHQQLKPQLLRQRNRQQSQAQR